MNEPFERLRRFVAELRRRNVYRVAVSYLALAFVGFQAARLLIPTTVLPGWSDEFFLFLLITGFPVALVVAWAFEMTPEGMRRTQTGRGAPSPPAGAGSVPAAAEPEEPLGEASGRGRSVAVLPFADMSPDRDHEYFGEGLAEEVLNALTQIDGLRVAARTSSFAYGGAPADVREIGEELGVAAVVEGSVRRSADQLRVTAQLVDAGDGYHLWSETFERELEDVFAIQDEITASIVDALQIELLGDEADRLSRVGTDSPEAYDLYLKGRHFWHRRHEVGLQTALGCFEEALERDPDFALALEGVAYVLIVLGTYGLVPPDQVRDRIRRTSGRAVEEGPDLPEAHASRGVFLIMFEYDWEKGLGELERAAAIDESSARALAWHGLLTTLRHGRPTGEIPEATERAVRVEPDSEWVRNAVGYTYMGAGRYEEALPHHERAAEFAPKSVGAMLGRGMARTGLGRHGKALEDLEAACSLTEDAPFFLACRAGVLARGGREAEARRTLRELEALSSDRYVDPIMTGMIEAALGNEEAAVDDVRASVEQRSPCVFGLMLMPPYEPLWTESAWADALAPMGVEL